MDTHLILAQSQLAPIVLWFKHYYPIKLLPSVTHTKHCLSHSLFHSPFLVKPNPPERLAVTVEEDKSWPFLRVSWEPPHKADTRSGWITLMYEIRVKLEQENKWEVCNMSLIQGNDLVVKTTTVN